MLLSVSVILFNKTDNIDLIFSDYPGFGKQNICIKSSKNYQDKNEIINSTGMKFKLIQSGSFKMGSKTGQPDEKPVHIVHISSFYLSVYEVTQEQYKKVTGENPSVYTGENLPVENVTWFDAKEFCRKLSEKEGIRYRLPTEAEWEYAAAGGKEKEEYVWGNNTTPLKNGKKYANVADESFIKKFKKVFIGNGYFQKYDDGFSGPSPVGSFEPNRYGLYDMAGNAFEWCSDWYVEIIYPDSSVTDPRGPSYGIGKCMRGGGWGLAPKWLRLSGRFQNVADFKSPGVGFRCVRETGK